MKRSRNQKFPDFLLIILLLSCLGCIHRPASLDEEFSCSYQPGPFTLTRQLKELKTIPVGSYPKSVTISPDQKRAYVCNLEGGSIDIIDADSLSIIKRIEFKRTPTIFDDGIERPDYFEEKPVETAFTAGGRYVWISLLKAGGVVVLDTQGKKPAGKSFKAALERDYRSGARRSLKLRFIPTGSQPKVIAVTPDEKWVFVANWRGENVSVIDTKKMKVVKKIRTGLFPRGICFTPTGAYVANFGSHTISEIDLKTLKKRRDFRQVGKNPRHLVMAPDGNSLYVSNHGDGHVRQIDLSTGQVIRSCVVGGEPRTICLSEKKDFLFVTNYKDHTLTAIDLASMTPFLIVDTLHYPVGASFDGKTGTLWVSGYLDKAIRVYRFLSAVKRQVAGSLPR